MSIFLSLPGMSLDYPQLPLQCGIEIRIDLIPAWNREDLAKKMQEAKHPVLLTLRSQHHGGQCSLDLAQRQEILSQLATLRPSFLDLECDLDPHFLKKMIAEHPDISFIVSYHNPKETPSDLSSIYEQMHVYPACRYKIAAKVNYFTDIIRMQECTKKHPRLSTICMGELGEWTRAISSHHLQFLSTQENTAPGQIHYLDFFNIYRSSKYNEDTSLYALIGNPVHNSQGHRFHNAQFHESQVSAMYLKILLQETDLPSFFSFIDTQPFQGFSVTMPFKEAVIPFLDSIDKEAECMCAVNTIIRQEHGWRGMNTDGEGAINALEIHKPIKGATIVLLGGGGTARAIAYKAIQRKAHVIWLNRTPDKIKPFAERFGCHWGALHEIPKDYDIIINATSHPLPIEPEMILPHRLNLEVTYGPKTSLFQQISVSKQCRIVDGNDLFRQQAMLQQRIWGF